MRSTTFKTLAATLFILLFNLGHAIVYVDADATGSNNGSSWANAYNEIYDAILYANGDDIWVSEGLYLPNGTDNPFGSLYIWQETHLFGGFSGTETSLDQRDFAQNETILSGNLGDPTIISDNCIRIIYVQNSASIEIDGIIIEDCFDTTLSPVDVVATQITKFKNCIFRNNYCENGSILRCAGGDVEIINCLFYDNTCYSILSVVNGGYVDMRNTNIVNNLCARSINVDEGDMDIEACIIYHNNYFLNPVGIGSADQSIIETGEVGITWPDDIYNVDPQFIDNLNHDYNLSLKSIAINKGNNVVLNYVDTDLNNQDRNSGGTVDIGCYEYQFGELLYVDEDATGNGSGSTWNNAFNNLPDAVDAISINGTIWVAEGTYYPTNGTSIDDNLNLPSGISLMGGFEGTEINYSERNSALYPTIITGNIGDPAVQTDNSEVLITISGSAGFVNIDGFILKDIYKNIFNNILSAGAIRANFANINVTNCIFTNNESYKSSCVHLNYSDAIFSNCLFYENHGNFGSFINSHTGDNNWIVTNCTFTDNTMVSPIAGILGMNLDASLYLANSIIWNNSGTKSVQNAGFVNGFNSIIEDDLTSFDTSFDMIMEDPEFIDPENNNYQLSLSSAAIDAGNNVWSDATHDLAGNNRIKDDIVDLGCYEYSFCPGDANFDGLVNITDLLSVSSFFGCQSNCTFGDANGDGNVDITDLLSVSSFFGSNCN